MSTSAEFEPPNDVLVNRRWVKPSVVEWVEEANDIMLENGAVTGTVAYEKRHQARGRARRLISLMVELQMHERWELVEHVSPHQGGYVWAVEYVGRGASNGR
jgi:hypothetical protein